MGKRDRERLSEEEELINDEVSDEEGDELEDDEDEDSGSEDSQDSEDRPKRMHKPFIPPPPRELPQRSTRGQRMGSVAAIQDDQADEEFWNQEFFAEEERDESYETESEPEDRFDEDFMESEEEESEGDEAEEEAKAREPKKKILRPPGYKAAQAAAAAKKKETMAAKGKATEPDEGEPSETQPQSLDKKKPRRTSAELATLNIPIERTVGVRESTRQKVQEGEEERKIQEALKPRRTSKQSSHRHLTQAELLTEAARTEIENTKSLQYLVAVEEENKKKAQVKKGKYVGPMVRWRSHAVPASEEDVDKNDKTDKLENREKFVMEQTTIEVRNMQLPLYLQPRCLPQPSPKPVCVITGKPARYRDPSTGLGYADLAAYKELLARRQQQMAAQEHRDHVTRHSNNSTAAALQLQQLQQQQYQMQQMMYTAQLQSR